MTHVAFLGLGLMGAPMARRLCAAGFAVRGWNRSRAKADALREIGLDVADTAAEAAQDAAIVCLCLTDASAVAQVLSTLALTDDAIVIDFSTIGVAATREFAARRAWVDAPVSGGVAGAERGDLTIFCGGTDADVARALPLLRAVGTRISHLGPVGAGQAAKLCNQLIVSANLLAIAEAIALARALDLDAARLVEALQGGFADSGPLRVFGPRMAAAGQQSVAGAVATMAKDVAAVTESAGAARIELPLQAATAEIYQHAIAAGLGARDLGRLIELYAAAAPLRT